MRFPEISISSFPVVSQSPHLPMLGNIGCKLSECWHNCISDFDLMPIFCLTKWFWDGVISWPWPMPLSLATKTRWSNGLWALPGLFRKRLRGCLIPVGIGEARKKRKEKKKTWDWNLGFWTAVSAVFVKRQRSVLGTVARHIRANHYHERSLRTTWVWGGEKRWWVLGESEWGMG